ncbi:MAG: sigma-54-dependent Fis family transcriptional regulator [Candidatus Rokuibacteriota bacterium]|nr:MAG: sigma-54-dependent Fis family transcriptional regulator [Candidatus Rokubacteria bacterium]
MTRAIRVLVADDERNLRDLVVRELVRKGHEVDGAGDGEAALELLREAPYDVAILDMKMPRKAGIDVLRELSSVAEPPQVIVMTGVQDVATAVEAMKLGAYDYLTKPTRIEELDVLVRKAAEKGQLVRDNAALRAHAEGAQPFGGIVTRSPAMHEVLGVVERVAPTDSAVLVLGESGTGKELVARAIHERSARVRRAFVPIHCGALPHEVFESELFGHEKGSFTGAITTKPGLVELADGGTLFLDEIGEMEPDSQVKVLRVLETGTFFRVGATRARRADLRLVAATNRDLDDAMRKGQFRQDLFYRVNTITVRLPPLREHREDIPLLAEHFLEQKSTYGVKKLSPAAFAALEAYAWPGNVRELLHAIERGVILAKGDEIQPEDLPPEVLGRGSATVSASPAPAGGITLESVERQAIVGTLRQVGGHRGKAAALLGIDPKTLYRKILGYGIAREEFS